MNRKELRQRGKGLLALMLACIMMFGTSMTVLAATHTLNSDRSLSVGQTLNGGDTISATIGSGELKVFINGKNVKSERGRSDETFTSSYILPTDSDYKVTSYWGSPDPARKASYYTVELESVPIAPAGGGDSTSGSNTGGSTASPEVLEASQTETGNGGGQQHVHSYGWVTTREATETQDGLEEYRCACGVVEAQLTIPASQAVVKGFYKAVREVAPDSQITYDTKDLCTMSDKMVICLSERTDVTVEITFMYQKTPYRMTIPAGSDYSALLADEDMFYGYFYFASQIGAQIEPVS